MNEIPKAFFSRGGSSAATTTGALEDARRLRPQAEGAPARHAESWDRARLLTGDLATEITKLKAEDGKPILAHGGAGFVRSLIATGLIDEYRFLVHPVALGQGLAIFTKRPSPVDLTLVESTRFASGAVANVYRPA